MARCLIIAGGCRGLELTRELVARGHVVRTTTRTAARLAAIDQAGGEGVLGDPDRVATLAGALEHVSVVIVLLGSAAGPDGDVAALHSTRLDMLLSKILDSTVRGIVYEAAGSVPAHVLAGGAHRVSAFAEDSHVPYALLAADVTDRERWLAEAVAAVERVLAPPRVD